MAQETLVEEMVVGVSCGKKEKKIVEEWGGEREREDLIVAILSPVRSWVGGEGWVALVHDDVEVEVAKKAMEREGKRKDHSGNKTREEAIFFADFGPDFLLSQTMESTRIYKKWKRDISFLLVSNIGL